MPSFSPGSDARPTLVYVATRWPWPISSGRQKMIAQVLETAARTHRVVLVALVGKGQAFTAPPPHVAKAYAVPRPGVATVLRDFLSRPFAPLQSHLFAAGCAATTILDIVRRESPDVAMLDMIRMVGLAPAIRAASPGVRVVLDMDDRLSDRYRQMRASGETNLLGAFAATLPPAVRTVAATVPSLILGMEQWLVARAELEAAATVDCVVFVSDKEASAFRLDTAQTCGTVLAFVPAVAAVDPRPRDFSHGRRFVFLGNADYAPNLEALRLLDAVAKSVLCARPSTSASFEAAGSGTDTARLETVQGVGFADDLDLFLGPDAVMVAPILTGTGVKTKLLDALARGVPVVTTPKGVEGLSLVDGISAVVIPPGRFAAYLGEAADGAHDESLSQIGQAGAEVARTKHSMSVVAAALSTVLDCPVPTRLTFSSAPRKKSVARHVGRFVHAATLAFADVAAIAVAFGLAFALARSFSPALTHVDFVSFHKAFFDRAPVALPILAAALLWNQSRGHYTERHPFWSEARDFLSLAALGIVAEGFIQFAVKEHISRTWIAASWTLFIPVCLAFRAWMKWALIEVGVRQIRVALFGSNLASVREAVESERLLGLHVVEEISGADPRTAAVLARKARAEFAVVAMGGEADGLAISIANHLSHEGIPFALCPPLGGIGLSSMRPVVLFGHDSVLLVERNGLAAPLAQAIKRAVDVVASILGLAVVSPVIAAAALAVKRDGGPAFYSQIRIGSNGRPIRIWKLRSMATDSDERLEHLLKAKPELRESWERDRKLKDDPRITWIGGFLRKSAIDELPQLLNVLIGDMSLVGPRPILRDEVTRYGDSARFYLGVRPGMTGLWQVSGRNDISYERRIELDAWYVRNWSLWVDTVVVLKTIPALICRCGAY